MSRTSLLLDVQDVSYVQDGTTLLAPVSLQLNQGEFVLLTGPSGSGKSTLLKIIASLLEPTTGDIQFKGRSISELKPESYRQQVSYCFQTPALFGDTVYDNLALPWQIRQKKVDSEKLKDWLKKVNLPVEMLTKKPNSSPAAKSSGSRYCAICNSCRMCCCWMKSPAHWMRIISRRLISLLPGW